MINYNGINRRHTGIHRPLTRADLASILRDTRKVNRQDARNYRDWLFWLGTHPINPAYMIRKYGPGHYHETPGFVEVDCPGCPRD